MCLNIIQNGDSHDEFGVINRQGLPEPTEGGSWTKIYILVSI